MCAVGKEVNDRWFTVPRPKCLQTKFFNRNNNKENYKNIATKMSFQQGKYYKLYKFYKNKCSRIDIKNKKLEAMIER